MVGPSLLFIRDSKISYAVLIDATLDLMLHVFIFGKMLSIYQ